MHVILAPSSGWSQRQDSFPHVSNLLAEVLEVSVSGIMASDPPKVQRVSVCSYGLLEIGTEWINYTKVWGLVMWGMSERTRTAFMFLT